MAWQESVHKLTPPDGLGAAKNMEYKAPHREELHPAFLRVRERHPKGVELLNYNGTSTSAQ